MICFSINGNFFRTDNGLQVEARHGFCRITAAKTAAMFRDSKWLKWKKKDTQVFEIASHFTLSMNIYCKHVVEKKHENADGAVIRPIQRAVL